MTILRAGDHLINIDRVTHVGPGTGGNNSTFHYDNGGITPSHMTLNEITHCLKRVEHPVADHHHRPPQTEPTPTVPEGPEDHEGLEEEPVDAEEPADEPKGTPEPEEDPYDESEENYTPELDDGTPIKPVEPQ